MSGALQGPAGLLSSQQQRLKTCSQKRSDPSLCRVGALPAAVATLSDLEDLHIRGELPIDEDDDQVCLALLTLIPNACTSFCLALPSAACHVRERVMLRIDTNTRVPAVADASLQSYLECQLC